MRKSDSQRFPASAQLFKFCMRILETRKPEERVHDQEVGNILQFNPSDTSHWKRGKKSVKSIYALENLSVELDVDVDTIHDLAEGIIDIEEAWYEHLEAEEYRRAYSLLTPELMLERKKRKQILESVAQQLCEKANVKSLPIYLPELMTTLPFVQVSTGDIAEKLVRTSRVKPGLYMIRHRKGDMRAHTRLGIAREIAKIIVYSERTQFNLPERNDQLTFFEVIDLSNALVIPTQPLMEELSKFTAKVNMFKSLADLFWIPKIAMRMRIANLLVDSAPEGLISHVNRLIVQTPLVQPNPAMVAGREMDE